ncbi:MAG TPA: PHB depolymerase family esterase [Mycobacteriales bacterium]|nr:PHB depolymerase family esterase [Mycobacteriales bacterium]HWC34178.1 PHB depolymerase family esterase [Mycobacteriales bacterium]
MRWVVKPAAIAVALALLPSLATAAPLRQHHGATTQGVTNFKGDRYPFRLYTPSSYRSDRAMPLVVVVHGCQTTAAQEERITFFDRLADRDGFVVLYPEVDPVGKASPGPVANCWKFLDPVVYFRGSGDTAAIAQMTRSVMRTRHIDPQRVYMVGVSAGGLITSASAGTYPDLYAAVGIIESAGYADGPCFTDGVGIPVQASAQLAHVAQGSRARVVPLFVMGSTGDLAFPQTCAKKALQQGLRTDNLALGGSQTGPISLTAASSRHGQVPKGRSYTVSTFRDPAGCLIGQQTIIDGMPHAWPGGNKAMGGYTDPTAPSGAKTAWSFFKHFTLSSTAMPCAETRAVDIQHTNVAPARD